MVAILLVEFLRNYDMGMSPTMILLQVVDVVTNKLLDIVDGFRGGLIGTSHSWVDTIASMS